MVAFSPSSTSIPLPNARASYTVRPKDITGVLSHRKIAGVEQYLVQWRPSSSSTRAVCSWHGLPELWHALDHVQTYIEQLPPHLKSTSTLDSYSTDSGFSNPRKRKSPGSEPIGSRDYGLLTPQESLHTGKSRSPSPVIDLSTPEPEENIGPLRYYGKLQKKEGRLIAKEIQDVYGLPTPTLPTDAMKQVAATTTVTQAEAAVRSAFIDKLNIVGNVRLENDVDATTPSLQFDFIKSYSFGEGIHTQAPDTYMGCTKCRPDMGGSAGCEYTQKCDCLEFAAVDERKLERINPDGYLAYKLAMEEDNGQINTSGLPKRFPYSKERIAVPATMNTFYRESRHPIYECNDNCECGPHCKNRLVQKGRKVRLVIFKTNDHRGWGVKCDEALFAGEFIDTYLGEVITDKESTKREEAVGIAKQSYLYGLDKFVGDLSPDTDLPLEAEECYVVDGQYKGNVTRFINHSCEPNCRQYTVSYNKHDLKLYNLAFFAYKNIPAGEELTFDYMDKDEEELEDAIRHREERLRDPENADKLRCNCGKPKCRGFLWDKD